MMKRRRVYRDFDSGDYFNCKYCTYQANDIDVLDKHISTTHAKIIQRISTNPKYSIVSPKRKPPPQYSVVTKKPDESGGSNVNKVVFNSGVVKCPFPDCYYRTVRKGDLSKHVTSVHKDANEVITYRCSDCSYETTRKGDMPKHLLSHCTGVELFGCSQCPYKTKRKNDMPKHMLCHKSPQELEIFRCPECPYSTKRKSDLNKHTITHSTAGAYLCTECSFATKRQNDLNKHVLVHCDKNVSGMFKCRKCEYGTDRINKFAKHTLSGCAFVDCCLRERDVKAIQELILQEEEDEDDVEQVDSLVEDVTKMLQGGESSKVIVLSELYDVQ